MVKPALHVEHMAAPSLVQAAPALGEPFGQLHLLAETHKHAHVCACVRMCVCSGLACMARHGCGRRDGLRSYNEITEILCEWLRELAIELVSA